MVAGLEQRGSEVAFALRGEPAWHGLANKIFDADEIVSTQEMLEAAKLDNWNVRCDAIQQYAPKNYNFVREPFFVIRTNPFDGGTDVLGTVGERYVPQQNEELFAFADGILESGASWESGGSIKDGRVVFGSLVIPREFTLDPDGANDTTKTYLLVNTSHDGSVAVQASVTPVRVVCQNTLNLALSGVKQTFKVRHTAKAGGRIEEAKQALGLTYNYMNQFEVEAKRLYETSISEVQWANLITAIYPKPEKDAKGAVTKWDNKIDTLNNIWDGPTSENIKGTAWGALNALTERLDYYRTSRGGNDKNLFAAASGFDPVINAEKNKIWKAVNTLVTV